MLELYSFEYPDGWLYLRNNLLNHVLIAYSVLLELIRLLHHAEFVSVLHNQKCKSNSKSS